MIEMKNVSFTYENGKATNSLQNINLTIKDGETILLCGESGCGKTTLTRLINGLIPHYYNGELTGEIILDGKEIKDYQLYQLAPLIGSVFQNPRTQFYNVDTTSEIVFACENMGIPVPEILQRLKRTTESLNLGKLLGRNIFKLSGGEKQKIACASADAIFPNIFVLDEPSSNLDMQSIKDLTAIIRKWQSEHKTIIIAEHRLYYLLPYVDRVLYMKKGKICQEYSKEEFAELNSKTLSQMGLRSLQPFQLLPEKKNEKDREKLQIINFIVPYKKDDYVVNIPNLQVPQGEIIGIMGNNGAGKTSFARCLCGLDKTSEGTLLFNDVKLDKKQRLSISYMVMQDVNHQLFTETVLNEILLSMDGCNGNHEINQAKAILRELDLEEKKELHPMSLSGGEKQRVAIGSAIVSGKKIIVFDEPTSGLDYRHMVEAAKKLIQLKNAKKTVFLITHDIELVYKCCSYIILMEKGRVLWHRPMDNKTVEMLQAFFIQ